MQALTTMNTTITIALAETPKRIFMKSPKKLTKKVNMRLNSFKIKTFKLCAQLYALFQHVLACYTGWEKPVTFFVCRAKKVSAPKMCSEMKNDLTLP